MIMLKTKVDKTKELLRVLNSKVDVYGREEYTDGDLNETNYEDIKIKSIWAQVIPQTGKLQKQVADTMLSNVSHKVIVRYEAGKDITPDMHLRVRDTRFDIKYILNPYYQNEWLEIFCEEVIE